MIAIINSSCTSKAGRLKHRSSAFDPSAATFLDFRTPQNGATRFFYVLPFDERHALVEYTLFSNMPLLPREYEQAMQAYLRDVLKIDEYRLTRQEGGVIPITDQPYPRRLGGRVMAIGMQGGRIKPSTGFAFMRVQSDSAAIVQSLLKHDQPFDVPEDSARYRLYDSMLLDIMEREPEQIQSIFAALFKRNSIEHVLSFLDEQLHLRRTCTCSPICRKRHSCRRWCAREYRRNGWWRRRKKKTSRVSRIPRSFFMAAARYTTVWARARRA